MAVAAPDQLRPLTPGWAAALRALLGVVWLYNGLGLKLLAPDPHHLAVVRGLPLGGVITPETLLMIVGAGETLLGLGVWSGIGYRRLAWFQLVLLGLMNALGILFSGAIAAPVGLLVQNLPLFFALLLAARLGPGSFRPAR